MSRVGLRLLGCRRAELSPMRIPEETREKVGFARMGARQGSTVRLQMVLGSVCEARHPPRVRLRLRLSPIRKAIRRYTVFRTCFRSNGRSTRAWQQEARWKRTLPLTTENRQI